MRATRIGLFVTLCLLFAGPTTGTPTGFTPRERVDAALHWLADHQHPDGRWDADEFWKLTGKTGDGAGYAIHNVGVTGLALLAFLGDGHTPKSGTHRAAVERGLKWLGRSQDSDGCYGPRTVMRFVYHHAIATMAMAEAYGRTGLPHLKRSAKRAIGFIHKCRNPYLAWRYGVRPQDNDTSVTVWMVAALRAAKLAGLTVSKGSWQGALAWIDKATEPEYGRVGYTARGTGPSRPQDLMDRYPSDKSEALTAAGIFIRVAGGEKPRTEIQLKGLDLCRKELPVWDEPSGSIDMYYWYWGTVAFALVGTDGERAWNRALRAVIEKGQIRKGRDRGAFPPVGPWGREGGKVYSTAIMTLAAEIVWRRELTRRK